MIQNSFHTCHDSKGQEQHPEFIDEVADDESSSRQNGTDSDHRSESKFVRQNAPDRA